MGKRVSLRRVESELAFIRKYKNELNLMYIYKNFYKFFPKEIYGEDFSEIFAKNLLK